MMLTLKDIHNLLKEKYGEGKFLIDCGKGYSVMPEQSINLNFDTSKPYNP